MDGHVFIHGNYMSMGHLPFCIDNLMWSVGPTEMDDLDNIELITNMYY